MEKESTVSSRHATFKMQSIPDGRTDVMGRSNMSRGFEVMLEKLFGLRHYPSCPREQVEDKVSWMMRSHAIGLMGDDLCVSCQGFGK